MLIRAAHAAGIILLFVAIMHGAAQQAANSSQSAVGLDQLYAGFLGEWVGQLQYRDFSDNSNQSLPTWLRVSRSMDGRSLQFAYVYDDGPSKTVKEMSMVSIDVSAATMTFTSDRDHSSDTYKIAGLPEFATKGRGTLTLSGTGTENDQKVDVRITLTLRRNLHTYQKETRLPGQAFQFRDGYTFTRKDVPQ